MSAVQFSYTKEDVMKAFNLHFTEKHPIRSRLMLLLGVLILGASLIMFVIEYSAYPNMKWIFMLMGIFYIGFYFYRKRMMVNLAMKNPTIAEMKSIELSPSHIKFSGDKGSSQQEWKNYIEYAEDNDSLLLYLTKENFFILPKRLFASEDIEMIKQAIKSNSNAN